MRLFVNGFPFGEARAAYPFLVDFTVGPMVDGNYQVTATVEDAAGHQGAVSPAMELTIDTVPPQTPSFDLAAASDTQQPGDQTTTLAEVTLEGTTDPNALVELMESDLATTADATGWL